LESNGGFTQGGRNRHTIVPDTKTEFKGLLTNETSTVKIEQTFKREDGKLSLFKVFKGYEFYLDGNAIGAVQVMPINKRLVWIHDDLDENMPSAVATHAVSLLVKNLLVLELCELRIFFLLFLKIFPEQEMLSHCFHILF
jgi:hypothetical protein